MASPEVTALVLDEMARALESHLENGGLLDSMLAIRRRRAVEGPELEAELLRQWSAELHDLRQRAKRLREGGRSDG